MCAGCLGGVRCVPLVVCPIGAGQHYSCSECCSVENVSKSFEYCEGFQATVSTSQFSAKMPSWLMKSYHALNFAMIRPVYLSVTQILLFQS